VRLGLGGWGPQSAAQAGTAQMLFHGIPLSPTAPRGCSPPARLRES
jgi:hypothetical protein